MSNCCRRERPYTYLKMTTSTCPECLVLVQARVVSEQGKVYFLKYCPDHGHSKALVSEDADYYMKAYRYARPGSFPMSFSGRTERGCPSDCGLCPSHQQHTCLPIVEITDHCDLECPVCMVDNGGSFNLSPGEFSGIVDRMVAHEGQLDNLTLSGGEPTGHLHFLELLDLAARPEIGRVSVVTNGLRLACSKELCLQLKEKNVYVILQFDGFSDEVYKVLRGKPLAETKTRALENLAEAEVPTQIAFVPVRGVNEDQIGPVLSLVLERDHILSLLIQPFAATGRSGSAFRIDPEDRITIPGVLQKLEEQSGGTLTREDFIPLPCPHPHCAALTYMLRLDDGNYLPFPRFVDMEAHADIFRHTATLEPSRQTEDALRLAVDDLWSSASRIPDSDKIQKALRRALLEMFPAQGASRQELIRIAERQAKTVFIHHYMDRYNFDLERLVKCCHHYPLKDGRVVPACGYNMFHRVAAMGPPIHRGPHGV